MDIVSFFSTEYSLPITHHAYYTLDSKFCDASSDATTLRYTLVDTPSREGELQRPVNFRNIKRMRCFPCAANFLPGIGVPSGKTLVNSYYTTTSTLTVFIKELAHTCYEKNNLRTHFTLQGICMNTIKTNGFPQIPANPYFEWVTSGKCDGWIDFDTPITQLSSISINLSDGNTIIPRALIDRVVLSVEFIYEV